MVPSPIPLPLSEPAIPMTVQPRILQKTKPSGSAENQIASLYYGSGRPAERLPWGTMAGDTHGQEAGVKQKFWPRDIVTTEQITARSSAGHAPLAPDMMCVLLSNREEVRLTIKFALAFVLFLGIRSRKSSKDAGIFWGDLVRGFDALYGAPL